MKGYLRQLPPGDSPQLDELYSQMHRSFGMVPGIFQSMSLRPDLLEVVMLFGKRLMDEEHALTRTTKELIAAYVSRINACEY